MAKIETRLNVGDTVWWVHCENKVYKGTIEGISCCDYQGALYCNICSPSFKRNPYPTVHYSNVFLSRKAAQDFADYQRENPDGVFPCCMGCHYRAFQSEKRGLTMAEHIDREAAIAYIREQSEECQKAFEELCGESGIYADAYNDLAEDFYRIPEVTDAQWAQIDEYNRANYAESHPWRNLWAWVKRKLKMG